MGKAKKPVNKPAKPGAPTSALFTRTEPAAGAGRATRAAQGAQEDTDDPTAPTAQSSSQARPSRRAAAQPQSGDDSVIIIGLALRRSEFDELQRIADRHHAARGSLLSVLMRFSMREHKAGRIKLTTERQKFTAAESSAFPSPPTVPTDD